MTLELVLSAVEDMERQSNDLLIVINSRATWVEQLPTGFGAGANRMENLQIVPVQQGVQPQYVEMRVPLYSYGCEKKVKKALSSLKGIYSVHVDYGMQKVTVWGICNRDNVLATVKKKRKGACFWDQAVAPPATEETAEIAGELQAAPVSQGFRKKAAFYRRFKMRRSWKSLLPLALVLSH